MLERQGRYSDEPEFDRLADQLADEIFDITAINGRLWSLIKAGSQDRVVDLTTESRRRLREMQASIEELQGYKDLQPTQSFMQHKVVREYGQTISELQRIQKTLASEERKQLKAARELSEPDKTMIHNDIELQSQTQIFEEQLRQDEVAYQTGLIQEREEEIQGIEQGINELNEIFSSLGQVVTQQGFALDNIEANIYSVAGATRDGANQLAKAARWQKNSTGRTLCILLILCIIVLVLLLGVSL